jgi:mRNA-degrading endonuclease RelE of RelBE toxin-antitoxin system
MLARAAMRRPAKLLKNSAAGMAYHVRISERALRDLEYIYASIQASSSEQSAVWLANNRCFQPRNLSERGSVTTESKAHRQILHGEKPHIYRIIYSVDKPRETVYVVHIRHGAMNVFDPKRV